MANNFIINIEKILKKLNERPFQLKKERPPGMLGELIYYPDKIEFGQKIFDACDYTVITIVIATFAVIYMGLIFTSLVTIAFNILMIISRFLLIGGYSSENFKKKLQNNENNYLTSLADINITWGKKKVTAILVIIGLIVTGSLLIIQFIHVNCYSFPSISILDSAKDIESIHSFNTIFSINCLNIGCFLIGFFLYLRLSSYVIYKDLDNRVDLKDRKGMIFSTENKKENLTETKSREADTKGYTYHRAYFNANKLEVGMLLLNEEHFKKFVKQLYGIKVWVIAKRDDNRFNELTQISFLSKTDCLGEEPLKENMNIPDGADKTCVHVCVKNLPINENSNGQGSSNNPHFIIEISDK